MGPVQRIVLVALGVVCLCAPWAGAQCYISNGDFEDAPGGILSGWIPPASPPAVVGDVPNGHSGSSGYVRFDDTTNALFVQHEPLVIPLANSVELIFFAKPTGAGTGSINVVVDTLTYNITRDTIATTKVLDAEGWTETEVRVPLDDYLADGLEHSISIEGLGFGAGESVLVDDVCLELSGAPGEPGGTCEGNEVDDPSFEETPVTDSLWVPAGTTARTQSTTGDANSGQYYMAMLGDGTLGQSITLATTDPYEFRVYVWVVTAGTAADTLIFSVDNVEHARWDGTDFVAVGDYRQTTIDISAFADGAAHNYTFRSTGTVEFRVDDICVVSTAPEPINACPTSAVSLLIEGDFEPDTCPDPVGEPLVIAAWDGDPDGVITTCQSPAVDGNGGSNGFANFETPSSISQSGIVLSDTIGAAWLSLWVKMPADVIDGQTLKVMLVNEVTTDELQIWPNATLDATELTEFYNDTFGGTNAGTYVNVVAIISSLTEDPTAHTLRIESEGSAEWFVDDLCMFGGGGFCSSGGTPIMTVISSIVEAEADGDGDYFVGRGATMLIELQYPANVLSVCVGGGQIFELQTEAGELFPLNDYLAFANPDTGLIQFQVPVNALDDDPPIDGITEVLIDSAPIADDFIIDTVPPIVGPTYTAVNGVTPVLDTVLNTAALPGLIGTDFMDLTATISDTLTGSADAPATVPAVNNPIQPGNFNYTPWDDVFTPDNRILTYATRSGRFAKVFFNDAGPLQFSLLCEFYDPPLFDDVNDVVLHVSGFSTDPLKYDLLANVTPTAQAVPPDSTQAPTLQDTDAANGFVDNHATAYWDDLSFPVPTNAGVQNSNYLNVRCSFHAMDRAGNVRAPQEQVLDGAEFWWMERAQSRLTPDWSGVQPTPDSLYFDFAMDRTYEPSPLGAPLPIFNVHAMVQQGGAWVDLGFLGWTPARRLTSAFFQDLVLNNPSYGNSWFLIELVGADEAGNFESYIPITPPADMSTITALSGPNWQFFFLQGQEEALNTAAGVSFWWNCITSGATDGVFRPVPGTPAQFEQFFGAVNIVPMPPDTDNYRVEAELDLRAVVEATVPRDLLRIAWELEDEQSGQVRKGIMSQLYQPTAKMVLPYDYSEGAGLNLQLTAIAPYDIYFGDPQLLSVRYYTFRASAQLVAPGEDPGDPSAVVANQDSTPAVFRFKVVPGSVQQYLEDFNDPQDQPIKELQRIE